MRFRDWALTFKVSENTEEIDDKNRKGWKYPVM